MKLQSFINKPMLKKGYKIARNILKKYDKGYYFASFFLTREMRHAIYTLYAFVRVPDEIVDNPSSSNPNKIKATLLKYQRSWQKAYFHKDLSNSVLTATAHTFRKYNIPYHYTNTFFNSMKIDLHKKTYRCFRDLKDYMQGSAIVVSLMMFHILGLKHKQALNCAENVGMALQLTNFIRDIKEDYKKRGRVYFPVNELSQFDLDPKTFLKNPDSYDFKKFITYQINRTRKYYIKAHYGLNKLPFRKIVAIKIGISLYEKILNKIERENYILSTQSEISFIEKLVLIPRALFR